jgi:hypothetical protein
MLCSILYEIVIYQSIPKKLNKINYIFIPHIEDGFCNLLRANKYFYY